MTVASSERLSRLAGEPERFPSALLLTGSSEAALERQSRLLAARWLCPGDDPDSRCGSCRRVASGVHPDFFSVEPDGVQIRVDRVREALAFSVGRPYESARRVARISRAELLGLEAENALLKALEEPGPRLRWILTTTRPEALLATIRSRTTRLALPVPDLSERQRAWQQRGFSEEDARDLILFAADDDADPSARLEEGRELRLLLVSALEEGLAAGHLAPLVVAAEILAARDAAPGKLLAELLADAALAAAGAPPAQALRHRAVAGRLAALGRSVPASALREAALCAAEPPADSRKGNRRLHFEKVLLNLYAATRR
jgi:DNA polymerase III, delta subunit